MSEGNPYKPPVAPGKSGAVPQNAFSAEGHAVGGDRGWEWIAAGWALFMRQPGLWIGIAFAWWLSALIVNFIPPLAIANIVVAPALLGGLMLGAHELQAGGELAFGHLFAGFRKNFGTLICVGLMYVVSLAIISLIAGIVMGFGALKALFIAMTDPALMQNMDSLVALVMGSIMTIMLGLLIGLALLVPVAMMLWFAPALIVLHDMGAIAALKASFMGCLKNILPFLVYSIILFVPFIVATMPLGLGWLVVGPLTATSTYVAYRDIFLAN